MGLKRVFAFVVFTVILTGLIAVRGGWAEEKNVPFPAFGSGPVEVRLYSDYFCPPCQQTEPHLEPILKNLLKRKVIRLTLADFATARESILYVRYFLYALKSRYNADHALRVRNVLFKAASDNDMLTEQRVEELFRKNKISYTVFDHEPVFKWSKALIEDDHIKRTPSCVIIKAGKKEIWIGGMDIYNALKALH